MKRRPYVRSKRRTARPASLKQQKIRKEAQKRAKYPYRIYYGRSVMTRCRNRGA